MSEPKFDELAQAATEAERLLSEARPIITVIETWPERVTTIRELYRRGQAQAEAVVRAATEEAARVRREADASIAADQAKTKAAKETLAKQQALYVATKPTPTPRRRRRRRNPMSLGGRPTDERARRPPRALSHPRLPETAGPGSVPPPRPPRGTLLGEVARPVILEEETSA